MKLKRKSQKNRDTHLEIAKYEIIKGVLLISYICIVRNHFNHTIWILISLFGSHQIVPSQDTNLTIFFFHYQKPFENLFIKHRLLKHS